MQQARIAVLTLKPGTADEVIRRVAPPLVYPVLQPPRSVPLIEGCSVEALAVHGGCAGDGHDAPTRHCV